MGLCSPAKTCLTLLATGVVAMRGILPAGADNAPALRCKGQPFMQNFTPRDYHADTQCWSAGQDSRGVIYVGNQGCVLEYDSASPRRIPVGKTGWTGGLAYDAATDRVYVGAANELDYLETAPGGERVFVSLLEQLPPTCVRSVKSKACTRPRRGFSSWTNAR